MFSLQLNMFRINIFDIYYIIYIDEKNKQIKYEYVHY